MCVLLGAGAGTFERGSNGTADAKSTQDHRDSGFGNHAGVAELADAQGQKTAKAHSVEEHRTAKASRKSRLAGNDSARRIQWVENLASQCSP